jgi:hypothetical protein
MIGLDVLGSIVLSIRGMHGLCLCCLAHPLQGAPAGREERVSIMGRLEREIQNHPAKVAKSALGPYLAWFAIVLVYGWPFAVFHGTARLAVGIPWLIITICITLVVIGNRKKTPRAPAKIPQKATNVAPSHNVSSAHFPSPNASSPLVADELRKLAELRDSDVLTEAEFMKQKKRLLG